MHPCPAPKCRAVDGNAELTAKPMCDHHIGRTAQALADLPKLYVQLNLAMARGATVPDDSDTGHTKAAAAPIPINEAARAAQDDMLAVTREAEHHYRAVKGWRRPRYGRELPTLDARCRFLRVRIGEVLELDVDYGVRVLRIKHASRSLLGLNGLVHRLDVACPYCDCMALVRDDGDAYVRCQACGVRFEQERYELLTRMVADSIPPQERPARRRVASAAEGFGW